MKKLFLTMGLAVLTTIGWGQDLFEMKVKTKDGMEREVVVSVTVNQSGADFNVEQAARNRIERLKSEGKSFDSWEQAFDSSVQVACLFTELFIVKHKATWVPSKVFLFWDPELKRYVGAVTGYAQNSFGVVDKIVDLVEMGPDGDITQRFP